MSRGRACITPRRSGSNERCDLATLAGTQPLSAHIFGLKYHYALEKLLLNVGKQKVDVT